MIPNLTPGVIGFGLWGLFNGYLADAAGPAVVLAFGIVVDNTIHFLSKYLITQKQKQLSVPGAIYYSFRRVGTALGVTSSILTLGFLVLDFSAFRPNQFLGQMTAISLAISLTTTYFILPSLLMLIQKDKTDVKN